MGEVQVNTHTHTGYFFMRRLATVRRIKEIAPIDKADRIELASVDGWKVVVKKGEFSVGDLAIYLEIDSFVPVAVAPFLTPKNQEPKEYQGIKGNRLKTVKLRGQVSQGLLLPNTDEHEEGEDLTEKLGILLYEPPIPAQLAGDFEGVFPGYVPKTGLERVQNLDLTLPEYQDKEFEVTEKLDGTSMSIIFHQGEMKVCSRNYSLKESKRNAYWIMANKLQLKDLSEILGKNLAIQGEILGSKIQGNPYKVDQLEFYVFDIYDIDQAKYLPVEARLNFCKEFNLNHVPFISIAKKLPPVDDLLKWAEGQSLIGETNREGLVLKDKKDPSIRFKVISNKYLVKGENIA